MKQARFLTIIILLLGFNSLVVGSEIQFSTENLFSTGLIAHPEVLAQKIGNIQTCVSSSPLLEAGNKYHIELWYDNSERYGPTEEAIALLLQDQLDATGFFDVELRSTGWSNYLSQLTIMPTFLLGWRFDYPDASNYIDPFVGSGAFSLGTNYSSPIMDGYIKTMLESSDVTLRQTAIRNALQLMAEDVPLVPLFTMIDEFVAYGSDISGVVLDPSGRLHFSNINKAASTDIVLGTTDSILNMDPADVYTFFASHTLRQISHGLFELPTDGMSVEPVLVDSYSISTDGLIYTFNLKSGVKFTDGSSVTVGDVIWSLNRSASLPGAPSFLLGGIDTSSFSAINSTAFSLQLTALDGTFLQRLAYTNAWVFKEDPAVTDTLQGTGYIPIGVGPYEITSWTPDVEMVLNASEHYSSTAIGTVAPVNDKVTIQFFTSSADLKTAIEGGTIDVAFHSFNPDDVKALEANPSLQTDSVASFGIRYLIVNVDAHPNKNIRKAISYAIDRERFTDIIFEGKNQGLYSMVPPGFDTACNKGDPCAFPDQDLDMVKTLMESEGYSAGVTPHDPISVSSNDEFSAQGFTGLGTFEVPYRLEWKNITSSFGTLISVSDTTAYFRIANCLLDGMYTPGQGISFSNVMHGTIDSNTITNNAADGISMGGSHNKIYNNTIYNNEDGIQTGGSTFNIFCDNMIYDNNANGMFLGTTSSHNIITRNSVYNNEYDGISIWENSDNITISENIVHSNNHGISVGINGGSKNNTISKNTVYDNAWDGIFLDPNTRYNAILDNDLYKNNNGISLSSSENNTIDNNKVYDNRISGIRLEQSDHNLITSNTVYLTVLTRDRSGISLVASQHNLISFNTVYHTEFAIDLGDIPKYNNITNNIVHDNINGVIDGPESHHNEIIQNLFYNNEAGFSLSGENYVITLNLFYDNEEQGIRIESTAKENHIIKNDFANNKPGASQAADDGSNNIFEDNYWNDWPRTGSYSIDGSAGNQDASPRENAYHLTAPVITAPTSATPTLKDSVTIQWTASSDTFGHSLSYSVFYSADNGKIWKKLDSELTTTKYTWDLTTIYDGTIVLLKVQTTDSAGFNSFSLSPSTFTIENPLLKSTTTTLASTTSVTTTSTAPVITPGWNVFVLLLSLIGMLTVRQRKKKT